MNSAKHFEYKKRCEKYENTQIRVGTEKRCFENSHINFIKHHKQYKVSEGKAYKS